MWRNYFAAAIRKLIPELEEMSETAFADMVDYWLFDVSGNDATEWWGVLEKLDDMDKEIASFLDQVADGFASDIALFRKYGRLEPMLAQLAPRFATEGSDRRTRIRERFQSRGYSRFVRYVQRSLVLKVPLLCLLGGEMSGDMFGIGATLLIDPDAHVLIMTGSDLALDHTAEIECFLKLSDARRVHVCTKSQRVGATIDVMTRAKQVMLPMPYYLGTLYLSFESGWQDDDDRGWIRDGWGVSNEGGFQRKCAQLAHWLVEQGLPLQAMAGQQVLVLWSRFTGKKGEIHVEHDTSFTGIRQLASDAAKRDYFVIIAGDRPVVHRLSKPGRARKFDDICAEVNKECSKPRVFNLTGFWREPSWTVIAEDRRDQFRLYELLHRLCDVRHLGMRSGNLEAMALMGYYTRYMEEVGSQGGERMSAWHGIGLGYERIVLQSPPTRAGKWVVENYEGASYYPKKLGWIATRNQGVVGTVGDPSKMVSKVKAPRLTKKQRKLLKPKSDPQNLDQDESPPLGLVEPKSETIVITSLPVLSLDPIVPKPDVTKFDKGFTETDRSAIGAFLESDNPSRRFDKLPFDWEARI